MNESSQIEFCLKCTAHRNACETKECPLVQLGINLTNTGRRASGVKSTLGINTSNANQQRVASSPALLRMRAVTHGGIKR